MQTFLIQYGYAVVFIWVLAEQAGLPIPAVPVLLGMGALIGQGVYSWPIALLGSLLACLIPDFAWFLVGRSKGRGVLKLLCRVSLEPDSCVKTTERGFQRYGWGTLLGAKFLPGLSTAAPPLAGMTGMSTGRFLLADSIGSLLWAGSLLATGVLFHRQLEWAAERAAKLGLGLGLALALLVTIYFSWKYFQRRRFLNLLRVNRITVSDLHDSMESDKHDFFLIDMRDEWEIKRTSLIPGARLFSFGDLEERHVEIPRDKDIVLYCS